MSVKKNNSNISVLQNFHIEASIGNKNGDFCCRFVRSQRWKTRLNKGFKLSLLKRSISTELVQCRLTNPFFSSDVHLIKCTLWHLHHLSTSVMVIAVNLRKLKRSRQGEVSKRGAVAPHPTDLPSVPTWVHLLNLAKRTINTAHQMSSWTLQVTCAIIVLYFPGPQSTFYRFLFLYIRLLLKWTY